MGRQSGRDRRVGRQIGLRELRPWCQTAPRTFEQLEDRCLLSIGSGWDYDAASADWFVAPEREAEVAFDFVGPLTADQFAARMAAF